jgi:hypothetical protein
MTLLREIPITVLLPELPLKTFLKIGFARCAVQGKKTFLPYRMCIRARLTSRALVFLGTDKNTGLCSIVGFRAFTI